MNKRIAILLVFPTDVDASPNRPLPEFIADLFLSDPMSLDNYWRQVSDGSVDLSGTLVFGWRTHGMTRMQYQALERYDKIKRAVDVFANASNPNERVNLSHFDSVVVFGDPADELGSVGIVDFDLQGVIHSMGTAIFEIGTSHSVIAHELGHSFGFDHSFNDSPTALDPGNDSRPGAYGDTLDIMSAARVTTFQSKFGGTGPGLNTVMRDIAGWLKPSRIINGTALGGRNATIYDVNDPNPNHPHVLRLDELNFEFVMNTGWYKGMAAPSVQVRIRDFNIEEHSKVLRVPKEVFGGVSYAMKVGDSFSVGSKEKILERYLRVTLLSVDTGAGAATLSVEHQPAFSVPSVGPGILFGGVARGGDGYIIINGHIIPVPPRGPLERVLESLANIAVSDWVHDDALRSNLVKASISELGKRIKSLGKG
jgi:hypothetical protein